MTAGPGAVPITMGSPTFRSLELDRLAVTEAWFPPGEYLPRHTHDRASVAVMLGGSFELAIAGQVRHCPPAAVFVEPAGESHSNRIGTGGARVLVVQPDPAELELYRPFAALLERPSLRHHAGIAGLAERLAAELMIQDDLRSLAVESAGLELLVSLVREDAGDRRGPPAWLLRAQELVHARFAEPVHAGEIARAVEVHPAHLARAFRAHFRMSLGSYVRRLRLEWAARRLGESEIGLAELAIAAGFADQSHFTRAFKRYSGVTPGAYRRSGSRRPAPDAARPAH